MTHNFKEKITLVNQQRKAFNITKQKQCYDVFNMTS